MRHFRFLNALVILGILVSPGTFAQEKLYPNEFSLSDVKLLDGPLKHSRDLNVQTLLKYDVDRFLAPFRKEAGLSSKAKSYPNWEGLDGHVGGHYLSALAMNYAATGNAECGRRMTYMIAELRACQDAHGSGWGKGYAGGVPDSEAIWPALKKGDFGPYHSAWVPWYNVHKIYAGLRDAWLYAGNENAKDVFLKFCDWGIQITAELSDDQMQAMLDTEHGGMNEIFADAYQITGDLKYLTAAKRFSHRLILDAMATDKDNLDNKHANTQVPKAIGFQRIGELSGDKKFAEAGSFFWNTVTSNRTLAFGGNSRREFFPAAGSCYDFVQDVEGPETCNTYNMLKLTEGLYRMKPQAKYVDFYEKAVINHILSTQHPEHGGYVYFTPARPRHYRVYSAPNEGMWCCVGSGMENHGKYNQFIYSKGKDSLYLNLFVASELTWKEKGVELRQETQFPFEEQTTLKITKGSSRFKLMVRNPAWVAAGTFKIFVNGKEYPHKASSSSYIPIDRMWKTGDEVKIRLPMHNSIERMPNVPNYIAIMHGPVLLGAKTGKEDMNGMVADDSRWGHIAGGKKLAVDQAPVIIEESEAAIISKIRPVTGKPLTFTIPHLNTINAGNLTLEPFFQIHDSRYMIYWMSLNNIRYKEYLDSIAALEKRKIELQQRTVDFVAPGEQQPEADHAMLSVNSSKGNNWDEFWRDARDGGFFSYNLSTGNERNLTLVVRYWGSEWGTRKFDIYVDEEKLLTVDNTGKWNQSRFFDVEYRIPESMVKGKNSVRVKFLALPGSAAGAVYYIRLVKNE